MHQTLDASKHSPARHPSGPVAWGGQTPAAMSFPRRTLSTVQGAAPKRPRILWTEDGSDLDLPDLLAAGPALHTPSPSPEEAAPVDLDAGVNVDRATAPKASTPAKGFAPFPRPAFSLPSWPLPVWPLAATPKRVAGIVAGVSLVALTGFLFLPESSSETGDRMVTTGTIHVQPDIQDDAASANTGVGESRFAASF